MERRAHTYTKPWKHPWSVDFRYVCTEASSRAQPRTRRRGVCYLPEVDRGQALVRTARLSHRLLVITGRCNSVRCRPTSTTKSTACTAAIGHMEMPINPTCRARPPSTHPPQTRALRRQARRTEPPKSDGRVCISARKVGALRALVETAMAQPEHTEDGHAHQPNVPSAAALHAPAPNPCVADQARRTEPPKSDGRVCTSARKVGALRALVETAMSA